MPSGWQEIALFGVSGLFARLHQGSPEFTWCHQLSMHTRCKFPSSAFFPLLTEPRESFCGHMCISSGIFQHQFLHSPSSPTGIRSQDCSRQGLKFCLTFPVLCKPFFSLAVTFAEILWKPEVQTNIKNDREISSPQQALLPTLQNFYLLRKEEEETQRTHTKNHWSGHQVAGIVCKIRTNELQYVDYLFWFGNSFCLGPKSDFVRFWELGRSANLHLSDDPCLSFGRRKEEWWQDMWKRKGAFQWLHLKVCPSLRWRDCHTAWRACIHYPNHGLADRYRQCKEPWADQRKGKDWNT